MSPRLLIVSFSVCPAPDRHGVQLVNVLKALAPRYSVDVLTLRAGTMPFHERFMKTRMLRVPVVGRLGEQVDMFRRAIRRQLEGEDYDVVHLRSAWGARAVLAGTSGRLVYEVARSTEGEPRAADASLSEALAAEELECLARAELIIVPTEAARASLRQRGLGERVEVVPPGVDVDHFDWEPTPSPDGLPRIVYSGRIAGGRGVRLLLRAVGQLRARRPLKLVLAGDIDDGFALILDAAIAESGLARDDVERLGAIDHDDMPRVLSQATLCVAPSAADDEKPLASFPTKLLEYQACRRAVVAPRRPAVQEVISDGETGLLFAPGDEADLARALDRLLADPGLRERLADAGYARVRARHPASATRRRLLAAYARVLPPSSWAPPSAGVPAIDALPSHPDSTTGRRLADHDEGHGHVQGHVLPERSGEIEISHAGAPEIPEAPVEVVLEIDAPPPAADEPPPERLSGLHAAPDDPFADESTTAQFARRALGFDEDGIADEKTSPRPLRPQNSSG